MDWFEYNLFRCLQPSARSYLRKKDVQTGVDFIKDGVWSSSNYAQRLHRTFAPQKASQKSV